MKYKVGQTVRVKNHPQGNCDVEECIFFASEMKKFIGMKFKVEDILGNSCYLEGIEYWEWTDCMLEPVKRGRPKKTLSKKQIDIKEIEITLLKFESKRLSLEDTVEEILKIYE